MYILLAFVEGSYLFFPIPAMLGMMFVFGVLGVTSYTIRLAATQSYVPDDMKGRFNGVFATLSTVGALLGQALAMLLSRSMPERWIVVAANALSLVAAVVFIGGRRREVAVIYNAES